jgi:uncharacterized protein with NAD-binding domain and iron-sulfur cluster
MDNNGRIEEHGLHIWFGSYRNAVAMMRLCYAELARPSGEPLSRFDCAFQGQGRFLLKEKVDGDWRDWVLDMPERPAPVHEATAESLLQQLVGCVISECQSIPRFAQLRLSDVPDDGRRQSARAIRAVLGPMSTAHTIGHMLDALAARHALKGGTSNGEDLDLLSELLRLLARALWVLIGIFVPQYDWPRHVWVLSYLAITALRGMIDDRLYRISICLVGISRSISKICCFNYRLLVKQDCFLIWYRTVFFRIAC